MLGRLAIITLFIGPSSPHFKFVDIDYPQQSAHPACFPSQCKIPRDWLASISAARARFGRVSVPVSRPLGAPATTALWIAPQPLPDCGPCPIPSRRFAPGNPRVPQQPGAPRPRPWITTTWPPRPERSGEPSSQALHLSAGGPGRTSGTRPAPHGAERSSSPCCRAS